MPDHTGYDKVSTQSDSSLDAEEEAGYPLAGGIKVTLISRRARVAQIFRKAISSLLIIFFITILLYISFTVHGISNRESKDYGDCGGKHTPEEARALGCIFDPAGWVWTRPECFDGDLLADFMDRTNFSYHTDINLTPESEVPLQEVMRGGHTLLYTQNKYHYLHCTYMMKKMHKALLEHGPTDSYLRSVNHIKHCEMVLLNHVLHEDKELECEEGDICPTWLGKGVWTSCGKH
ncbi:hypothetical protein GGR51DRAFT_574254 [Nemania sp. FL0031]|nr:hypothetical protein GGR51DRAFT_574254 [Nemania sp. FL0031]